MFEDFNNLFGMSLECVILLSFRLLISGKTIFLLKAGMNISHLCSYNHGQFKCCCDFETLLPLPVLYLKHFNFELGFLSNPLFQPILALCITFPFSLRDLTFFSLVCLQRLVPQLSKISCYQLNFLSQDYCKNFVLPSEVRSTEVSLFVVIFSSCFTFLAKKIIV